MHGIGGHRTQLFPTHFKQLYPGHPNLDSYIFGGGGGGAHYSSSLKQVSWAFAANFTRIGVAVVLVF